jgi:hypothetical protein
MNLFFTMPALPEGTGYGNSEWVERAEDISGDLIKWGQADDPRPR